MPAAKYSSLWSSFLAFLRRTNKKNGSDEGTSRNEKLEDFGAALVISGVILEAYFTFAFQPTAPLWEKLFTLAAGALVAIGVLIEFRFGGNARAEANTRTAEANARAAEAEARAEEARERATKLEVRLAPRLLTISQQKAIGISLSEFGNIRVDVHPIGDLEEIKKFSATVTSALTIAGWTPCFLVLRGGSMSGVVIVVSKDATLAEMAAAIKLRSELIDAGIDVKELTRSDPLANLGAIQFSEAGSPSNSVPITIMIGEKP